MTKMESRTYVLTATPAVLARIERFLTLIWKLGAWGSSRTVKFSFDGDGSDRLVVEGHWPRSMLESYNAGARKAIESGYDPISISDGGFLGFTGDKPRRRWRDDGSLDTPVERRDVPKPIV